MFCQSAQLERGLESEFRGQSQHKNFGFQQNFLFKFKFSSISIFATFPGGELLGFGAGMAEDLPEARVEARALPRAEARRVCPFEALLIRLGDSRTNEVLSIPASGFGVFFTSIRFNYTPFYSSEDLLKNLN